MNDRQLRNSEAVPSQRPRQSSLRTVDDDKQRERKRALDRKAQRASREKTRSHIAHLEMMVQVLSEKNGSTATGQLVEEMNRLHAEIERLRKIIDSIKSVLGADVIRSNTSRQAPRSVYHDHSDSPEPEMKFCEVASPSDECNQTAVDGWGSTMNMSHGDINEYATVNMELGEVIRETPVDSNSAREISDWKPSLDEASVALAMTGRWDRMKSPKANQAPIWCLPSPMKTTFPTSPPPDFGQCCFWKKANSIYARIFDYGREEISAANDVDSGSLFKVVKEGWESLSPSERHNPVLQILEEVDQYLFWDLDPVTKIANLYKSHLILKYYFNAERRNLELLPVWQRPVYLQQTRQHPLPIDFFPWPALRNRLMRHHHYYFATSEFSVTYRENFKFHWPFGFDETYRYSPTTRTYRISPLFERYYSDENSWTLNRLFFDRFPEYIGEIPIHQVGPETPSSLGVQSSQPPGAGVTDSQSTESNTKLEDECMMALFDDIPPT